MNTTARQTTRRPRRSVEDLLTATFPPGTEPYVGEQADPRVCPECGKRYETPRYRREHQAEPFAHLTRDEYLGFTAGFVR